MNPQAATLRLAVLPRIGRLADVMLVLAGTGLVAGAAQISFKIPGTPVPITGQTFAVVLVGAALGSVLGFLSLSLYLFLGMLLPFYASGAKGIDEITGPSGGYIIGFVAAAALTGFLAERGLDRKLMSAVGAMFVGNVIIYLCGLPWLAVNLNVNFNKTMEYGLNPFIVGDVIKLIAAGALLPGAWAVVKKVNDSR
jgi:biotin transport system substrate-specific component